MVVILDNSSADIAIVMPKPDLSRDEFSYSNLYCFDYDGAASGVTGSSVESSPSSISGNGGDDTSVSVKDLFHNMCSALFQLFFSPPPENHIIPSYRSHQQTTPTTSPPHPPHQHALLNPPFKNWPNRIPSTI